MGAIIRQKDKPASGVIMDFLTAVGSRLGFDLVKKIVVGSSALGALAAITRDHTGELIFIAYHPILKIWGTQAWLPAAHEKKCFLPVADNVKQLTAKYPDAVFISPAVEGNGRYPVCKACGVAKNHHPASSVARKCSQCSRFLFGHCAVPDAAWSEEDEMKFHASKAEFTCPACAPETKEMNSSAGVTPDSPAAATDEPSTSAPSALNASGSVESLVLSTTAEQAPASGTSRVEYLTAS